MTAKEYLRQAYRLNERINSHIEELENLRDLSTRIQGVSYGEHIPSPNRTVLSVMPPCCQYSLRCS